MVGSIQNLAGTFHLPETAQIKPIVSRIKVHNRVYAACPPLDDERVVATTSGKCEAIRTLISVQSSPRVDYLGFNRAREESQANRTRTVASVKSPSVSVTR